MHKIREQQKKAAMFIKVNVYMLDDIKIMSDWQNKYWTLQQTLRYLDVVMWSKVILGLETLRNTDLKLYAK